MVWPFSQPHSISSYSLLPSPVSNHGIPEPVIGQTLDAAKSFFTLPLSAKEEVVDSSPFPASPCQPSLQLDIHKSPNFKGYTPLLAENSNPENQGDLHEGFDVGWEDPVTRIAREEADMDGENVWPEGLPGFREKVMDY